MKGNPGRRRRECVNAVGNDAAEYRGTGGSFNIIFAYLGANLNEYHQQINEKVCNLEILCPQCGKPTVFFGFARLRKLIMNGIPHQIALRRVRCKPCAKTHVVLPDFVCAYKHYSVFDIEMAVSDLDSGLQAEQIDCTAAPSTIRRWYKSFTANAASVIGNLQAVLKEHFDQTLSELRMEGKRFWEQLSLLVGQFPPVKASDFLISHTQILLTNLAHTHTLRGMTAPLLLHYG